MIVLQFWHNKQTYGTILVIRNVTVKSVIHQTIGNFKLTDPMMNTKMYIQSMAIKNFNIEQLQFNYIV